MSAFTGTGADAAASSSALGRGGTASAPSVSVGYWGSSSLVDTSTLAAAPNATDVQIAELRVTSPSFKIRPVYMIPLGAQTPYPTRSPTSPAPSPSPRQGHGMTPRAGGVNSLSCGHNAALPEPVPTESRKQALAETARLTHIEEQAVIQQAELLLTALGATIDNTGAVMDSATATAFVALSTASLDKNSLAAALRTALAGLTRKDLNLANDFDRHMASLAVDQVGLVARKERAMSPKSPRGHAHTHRRMSHAYDGDSNVAAGSSALANAIAELEEAAIAAAGGGIVASAVASLDCAAALDSFVTRKLYGMPKGALLCSVPPNFIQVSSPRRAVTPGGRFASASDFTTGLNTRDRSESTTLPSGISSRPVPVFDPQCLGAPLGSNIASYAPLLAETLTRVLMVAHARGSLAPLMPKKKKQEKEEDADDSDVGEETARRSPNKPTAPSWRQAPKRLPAGSIRVPPLALSAAVTKALFVLGLEPRAASLVQFALGLRVRFLQVATALATECALESLRLPPLVAATLGCPLAAGSDEAQATARHEIAKGAARRSSLTSKEIEEAIEMGRERGYLKYARTIPGLKFKSSPPKKLIQDDKDEEIDNATDPKINFVSLLSDVERRSAARFAATSTASGRIQTLNVEDVKYAAKQYVAKVVRERQAALEA